MTPSAPIPSGTHSATFTRVPTANPHVLSEAASVLLDVVRLTAALAVVFGHLTLPELHAGFPDHCHAGEYAVPVFFVLSGFVIRFVTRSREHTLRAFFIDRASRMYSIMIPAMLLTLLVSGLCLLIDRQHYLADWGGSSDHVLSRVLLNLTFLSQSWGHNTIPLVNVPFWSLSYECLYYIGYGLLFFLRGWKRVLAVFLWAAVAGPQVLFLFPIWWLGCWIYDLYHHLRLSPVAARILRLATVTCLVLATALSLAGSQALLLAPFHLLHRFALLPNPLALLHLNDLRPSLQAVGSGILAAVAMLLLLLLSDAVQIPRRNIWARRFRRIADGTFAIYLMHYPLLVLALFFGLIQPNGHARSVLVAIAICLLLIVISAPLDRLKQAMRDRLGHHLLPNAPGTDPGRSHRISVRRSA
jgi:peptidoglycan/LPS O-acetylase OafA/YrhL